jgi:hypothetical protein
MPHFRPDWRSFAITILLFALIGGAYAWAVGDTDFRIWTERALQIIIPVFTLGVGLMSLTRSVSEAGQFTGEYINDACRMPLFCCLTFLAAMIAFAGWLMGTITWFHPTVIACVAAASVGAAITCLAMLAFVMRKTIVCLTPTQSIRVVSHYAARKLCYGYLKEVFVKLVTSRQKDYLDKWCLEHYKAIHPPSQYFGYYFKSHTTRVDGNSACRIELSGRHSRRNLYKDFHLKELATLDKYLDENGAELYLSPVDYESEQVVLGGLNCGETAPGEAMKAKVRRLGRKAIRLRRSAFEEASEDFWNSQKGALNEAIEKAVGKGDPIQVRAYLNAVNEPLTVLRQARSHKPVRDACGEYIRRDYEFLGLYLTALQEILMIAESGAGHRSEQAFTLARTLLQSIWEETRDILKVVDYHTMGLFTWLVQQMYRVIQEAGDEAKSLKEMRAQFGGFYTFAEDWLEEAGTENSQDVDKMRLVLYEGLTKWLLMAVEKKDDDLVEQLSDAGRTIAFGRKGKIAFNRGDLVARHFVLAGHLMYLAKAGGVKATAVERLFCEEHCDDLDVDFEAIVGFYLNNPFPPQTIDSYLHIFFKPEEETKNLLIGSSGSSGFGMTGQHEMALAFIYLASSALSKGMDDPQVIPEDMSFNLNKDAMKVVADLFQDKGLNHGIERLEKWVARSRQSEEEAEAKRIADAQLDPAKVEEWQKEFWARYSRSSPILSMCLRNGDYQIDKTACTKLQDRLFKITVIDWKYPVTGDGGNDHARRLARYMEGQLLGKLAEKAGAPSKVGGELPGMMSSAADWLKNRGCNSENGILVSMTKHGPASELYSDKDFVPPWKEDVRSLGFDGFYKGFPLVWLREGREPDAGTQKQGEPRPEQVTPVDLRGWKGMRVREHVITERKFGELTIRPWTDKEIQDAIDSKRLDAKDVTKAKGNCPVEICLHWQIEEPGDSAQSRASEARAVEEPKAVSAHSSKLLANSTCQGSGDEATRSVIDE